MTVQIPVFPNMVIRRKIVNIFINKFKVVNVTYDDIGTIQAQDCQISKLLSWEIIMLCILLYSNPKE